MNAHTWNTESDSWRCKHATRTKLLDTIKEAGHTQHRSYKDVLLAFICHWIGSRPYVYKAPLQQRGVCNILGALGFLYTTWCGNLHIKHFSWCLKNPGLIPPPTSSSSKKKKNRHSVHHTSWSKLLFEAQPLGIPSRQLLDPRFGVFGWTTSFTTTPGVVVRGKGYRHSVKSFCNNMRQQRFIALLSGHGGKLKHSHCYFSYVHRIHWVLKSPCWQISSWWRVSGQRTKS